MAAAIVSLLRRRPVRSEVAMTGEISLRGLVLPVGGIRDKVLAAERAGIRTVILPKRNENDLEEVPENIRQAMHFELADQFDEALAVALATGRQRRPRKRVTKAASPEPKAKEGKGRKVKAPKVKAPKKQALKKQAPKTKAPKTKATAPAAGARRAKATVKKKAAAKGAGRKGSGGARS